MGSYIGFEIFQLTDTEFLIFTPSAHPNLVKSTRFGLQFQEVGMTEVCWSLFFRDQVL